MPGTNNEQIKAMRSDFGLTIVEIAALIGSQVNTVKNWVKDPQANGYRPAPDHAVRCLAYALHLRTLGVDPLAVEIHTSGNGPQAHESGGAQSD